MEIYHKVKWVLGIFMIFFLILATNLIDKDNFTRVKNSVVTIYEDRLIAQNLIFEFLELVHEKEMAVTTSNPVFFEERNSNVNLELERLESQYLTTKLTNHEESVFSKFRSNLNSLKKQENNPANVQSEKKAGYLSLIVLIKENLHELSEIQVEEGRNQSLLSKDAIETVELFTQIEIYLLIFLAILVQVIVLIDPKKIGL